MRVYRENIKERKRKNKEVNENQAKRAVEKAKEHYGNGQKFKVKIQYIRQDEPKA